MSSFCLSVSKLEVQVVPTSWSLDLGNAKLSAPETLLTQPRASAAAPLQLHTDTASQIPKSRPSRHERFVQVQHARSSCCKTVKQTTDHPVLVAILFASTSAPRLRTMRARFTMCLAVTLEFSKKLSLSPWSTPDAVLAARADSLSVVGRIML